MFSYCTRVLHLAEGAAYNRIEAARAARSYPVILEMFEESAITLTAVRLLAPHLTPENHAAVLASARHKSKREIEELAASLKPMPDAPMVVRKLPAPRSHAGGARWRRIERTAPSRIRARHPVCRPILGASASTIAALIVARDRAARSGTLPDSAHRLARDARQIPACAGVATPFSALRRRRRDLRSRCHAPGRTAGASTLRRNRAPASMHGGRCALAPHPGRRAAGRVAKGWWTMRVRWRVKGDVARPRFWNSTTWNRMPLGEWRRVENIELRCRLCRCRHKDRLPSR